MPRAEPATTSTFPTTTIATAAAAAVLLPMPLVLDAYSLIQFSSVLVFAIACMGMKLVFGTAGLLSFGHATFFAIAAYAGAFLSHFGKINSFEVYFVFGVGFSVLLAVLLGYLSVRATRIHFTILTLAFCQMVYSLFVNGAVFEMFGGEGRAIYYVTEGGMYVRRLTLLGQQIGPQEFIPTLYNVIAVTFIAAALMLWRIDRSPFGLALNAVRDNALRAAFVGIRVRRYRWHAFILSAGFVAVAGSLYGQLNRQITPEQLDWLFSAKLVLALVLGGSRHYLGPILGAALFVALEDTTTGLFGFHELTFGVLLIAAVFLFPNGLAGAAAAAVAPAQSAAGEGP